MELLINPEEILDLIKEVGQFVQLCNPVTQVQANYDYGIPEQHQLSCRKLEGYAIPESRKEIAVSDTVISQGGYNCYVLARSLQKEEILPDSKIEFVGKLFNVEYIRPVVHRGQILMHHLKLVSGQEERVIESVSDPAMDDPIHF